MRGESTKGINTPPSHDPSDPIEVRGAPLITKTAYLGGSSRRAAATSSRADLLLPVTQRLLSGNLRADRKSFCSRNVSLEPPKLRLPLLPAALRHQSWYGRHPDGLRCTTRSTQAIEVVTLYHIVSRRPGRMAIIAFLSFAYLG